MSDQGEWPVSAKWVVRRAPWLSRWELGRQEEWIAWGTLNQVRMILAYEPRERITTCSFQELEHVKHGPVESEATDFLYVAYIFDIPWRDVPVGPFSSGVMEYLLLLNGIPCLHDGDGRRFFDESGLKDLHVSVHATYADVLALDIDDPVHEKYMERDLSFADVYAERTGREPKWAQRPLYKGNKRTGRP